MTWRAASARPSFAAIDGLCDKHAVEKIETIGDAYVAATGCTASAEDICFSPRTPQSRAGSMPRPLKTWNEVDADSHVCRLARMALDVQVGPH